MRVVGVNPGPVATARIERLMRERRGASGEDAIEATAGFPLGRAATVREVADLFVFLASPRSAYTSGVVLTVDGGLSSRRAL